MNCMHNCWPSFLHLQGVLICAELQPLAAFESFRECELRWKQCSNTQTLAIHLPQQPQ